MAERITREQMARLGDQIRAMNLHGPPKILQHTHRFEAVTPDVSMPGTPHEPKQQWTPPDDDIPTPPSLSTQNTHATDHDRSSTPSQFVFRKPHYDKKYIQTHFHHPPKKSKDNLFHELKRFFKGGGGNQSGNNSPRNSLYGTTSNWTADDATSRISFANDFNSDIEGRYGKWGRFVGKGAGGSVRLIRRHMDGKTFAVKQFRKRAPDESEKEYVKKVTAEFCIGSTLHHVNVIETLDMVREGPHFYEIMEYAPNDLFNIVMSGEMTFEEIACCWRQMMRGVAYLHSMGIAHRDLKLDNIMLDERGILKLIDFGCATVFKYPYDDAIHLSRGLTGSDPYIAPEQFRHREYDPRKADMWSCGVIFVCMVIRRFPWRVAEPSRDLSFKNYLDSSSRGASRLFSHLPPPSRPIMSRLLNPDPIQRCLIDRVEEDGWVSNIITCDADRPGNNHVHHLVVQPATPNVMSRGNLAVLGQNPHNDKRHSAAHPS